MALTKINVKDESIKLFEMISKQWMLLSAGTPEKWNTMTANWGGLGILWHKPVANIYVRHSRYTMEFIDDSEFFTVTFLQDGHRDALNLLGTKSGRDIDKMKESGLTPIQVDGQPSFAEAELVLVCRKQCKTEIAPEDILDQKVVSEMYADQDYHAMYIGEIVAAYRNL